MTEKMRRVGRWTVNIVMTLVILFCLTMCTYAYATDDTPSPRERCQARHGQVVEDGWGHFDSCILPAVSG